MGNALIVRKSLDFTLRDIQNDLKPFGTNLLFCQKNRWLRSPRFMLGQIFFSHVALTGPRSVVICQITFLIPFGILFATALHLPWSGTF